MEWRRIGGGFGVSSVMGGGIVVLLRSWGRGF